MQVVSRAPAQRSKVAIAFTTTFRLLFVTLLFTAGGMGLGLFLGIIGMTVYALLHGGQVDMTHAYKHVAFPVALTLGAVAFVGGIVLEMRSRRARTSR